MLFGLGSVKQLQNSGKTHVVCEDFDLLLNPERDYDMAVKQVCRFCEHFLKHGPNVSDRTEPVERFGNPNRFLL